MLRYQVKQPADKAHAKPLAKMTGIFIALVLGVICYSISVYAWFQAGVVNTGNRIQAAEYHLDVSVVRTPDGQPVDPIQDAYPLTAGEQYDIVLSASGGATTGHCVIQGGQSTLYTANIPSGSRFTFSITPSQDRQYTFSGHWGTPEGDVNVTDGAQIQEEGRSISAPAGITGFTQPTTAAETPDSDDAIYSTGFSAGFTTANPIPPVESTDAAAGTTVTGTTNDIDDTDNATTTAMETTPTTTSTIPASSEATTTPENTPITTQP